MEVAAVAADGARFAAAVPSRQLSVPLEDCPAAVLETGPALPAGFPHQQDPCTMRSTDPPECYIRRGSVSAEEAYLMLP